VTKRQPSSRRFLTGLLGSPIAQSAAPAMHERAAEALGFRCHYQLIEVAGAGREELKVLLDGVRRLGFAGINVTFPYKEAVLDLLDELSPGAARIGAVNTVIVRDGRLTGHNTDTTGFARAIGPLVAASSRGPVAVIGAGGVGKAIAFALAGLGVSELRIFDSERAKAMQLAAENAALGIDLFDRQIDTVFPVGADGGAAAGQFGDVGQFNGRAGLRERGSGQDGRKQGARQNPWLEDCWLHSVSPCDRAIYHRIVGRVATQRAKRRIFLPSRRRMQFPFRRWTAPTP